MSSRGDPVWSPATHGQPIWGGAPLPGRAPAPPTRLLFFMVFFSFALELTLRYDIYYEWFL